MILLKKNINIYRRYLVWKKTGAIFIHVPKVAGTSISYALYGKTLGHYRAVEIQRKFPALYGGSYTFGFVRDPLERLYSAYNFAKKGRTESMGVVNPSQYQIPEFDNFESFVLEWLRNKEINTLDNIFKEQSYYLCDNDGSIIVDDVYCLENLDSSIDEINRKTGKSLSVDKKNVSNKSGYCKEKLYSKEMEEAAMNVYRKDYDLFFNGV